MRDDKIWKDLFTVAEFHCLEKGTELPSNLKSDLDQIQYDPAVDTFAPERKNEFLLGRLCASLAYSEVFNQKLTHLPVYKDRAPVWPLNAVGSISHNKRWVGAAVAKSSELLGVGIDFEIKGRTKLELAGHIRSEGDLPGHPELTEEELLTLIFSCKESLYKALYPKVLRFFGFQDAAVRAIDTQKGLFTIELLTELSNEFSPSARHLFNGRFGSDEESLLTVIEVRP